MQCIPTTHPQRLGWIYVANVLTHNDYEGVKVGGTERPVQERINEHRYKFYDLKVYECGGRICLYSEKKAC